MRRKYNTGAAMPAINTAASPAMPSSPTTAMNQNLGVNFLQSGLQLGAAAANWTKPPQLTPNTGAYQKTAEVSKRGARMSNAGKIMSGIAPFLNAIPVVGQIAAPIVGAAGAGLAAGGQKKLANDTQNAMEQNAANVTTMTSNPMGYALGGQHRMFQGPSHAKGGVAYRANSEVEGGETSYITPEEEYIFASDPKIMKIPKGQLYAGMTPAEAHKRIMKKYGSRVDPISKQTMEMEIAALKKVNDNLKAQYEQTQMMKTGGKMKYGPGGGMAPYRSIVSPVFTDYEGTLPFHVAPEPDPIGSFPTPPRKMPGSDMKLYQFMRGELRPPVSMYKQKPINTSGLKTSSFDIPTLSTPKKVPTSSFTGTVPDELNSQRTDKNRSMRVGDVDYRAQTGPRQSTSSRTGAGGGSGDPTALPMPGAAAYGAGKLAELVTKAGLLVKGYDREKPNYDRSSITAPQINPNVGFNEIDRQFAAGRQDIRNATDSTGVRMSNMAALHAAMANAKSKHAHNVGKTNKLLATDAEKRRTQQSQYNAQAKTLAQDLTARNKAAFQKGISDLGESFGEAGRGFMDFASTKAMNATQFAVLQELARKFKLNPQALAEFLTNGASSKAAIEYTG